MRISDCSSDVCSSDLNDTRLFNLSRRDADIAFRFGSFDQEDLVLRKVADVTYGLYASQDYLEKRGRPNFDDGSADHAMVLLHADAGRVLYRQWLQQLMPDPVELARADVCTSVPNAHLDSRHLLEQINNTHND